MAARSVSVGPVEVAVVAVDGAPALAPYLDALRREVIEVAVSADDVVAEVEAPERAVVLLWVPAGLSAARYERVADWAARRQPRAGLLGCALEGTTADSERALAAGFDDFVAGRCSTRELAARVRAVHRRVHWPGLRTPGRLRFGNIVLNTDSHQLWLDGRAITLTGTELAVFRALLRARGRALSRADLLDQAWGEGNLDIGERAVDNVILRLRRKIQKPGLIQTVRGVGFRLSTD
jgi:two-component system, OmpR family, phosphate regulon response regulator PhoB